MLIVTNKEYRRIKTRSNPGFLLSFLPANVACHKRKNAVTNVSLIKCSSEVKR